jgi:hypothetical protein
LRLKLIFGHFLNCSTSYFLIETSYVHEFALCPCARCTERDDVLIVFSALNSNKLRISSQSVNNCVCEVLINDCATDGFVLCVRGAVAMCARTVQARKKLCTASSSLCLVYFRPNVAELMARGVIFRPASAAAALSRSALCVCAVR